MFFFHNHRFLKLVNCFFFGGNGLPIPFLRFFLHKKSLNTCNLKKSRTFAENIKYGIGYIGNGGKVRCHA